MSRVAWRIEAQTPLTLPAWRRMRQALWPELKEQENTEELETMRMPGRGFSLQWRPGVTTGCREFASDALLETGESHSMHRALGFEETGAGGLFPKGIEQLILAYFGLRLLDTCSPSILLLDSE